MAGVDGLVGGSGGAPLLTYPQLQNLLRIEFARARRYAYPLSCMVVQVDGLDRLRELRGNAARDAVLEQVVKAIQAQTRTSDSAGLYQERVALILPHTDVAGVRSVAERMRETVAALPAPAAGGDTGAGILGKVTVSCGIAAFAERGTVFYDSILKLAEAALAEAVAAGGDRIEVAAGTPGPAPMDV